MNKNVIILFATTLTLYISAICWIVDGVALEPIDKALIVFVGAVITIVPALINFENNLLKFKNMNKETVEQAAGKEYPLLPVYQDQLDNLPWHYYIEHLRIAFKSGAEWQSTQQPQESAGVWVSVEHELPPFNKKVWFRGEVSWKKEDNIRHFEDELTMEEEQLEYGQFGFLLKEHTDFIVTHSNLPKTDLCSEYITHWQPLPPSPTPQAEAIDNN